MPIVNKSEVIDEKGNVVTLEEELVKDGKVVKTKKYQVPLKDFTPRGIMAARKKYFGCLG